MMRDGQELAEYERHYNIGWRARVRDLDDALDRYQRKHGSAYVTAWEDGHFDNVNVRPKWWSRDHDYGTWEAESEARWRAEL